jgi:hypothetical protein
MNTPPPFEVTSETLKVVASLLRQHPGMHAGLNLVPYLELLDDQWAVEARLERETFWMEYDPPEKLSFSQWPRVELCGQSVPIAPAALERLRGKTLTLEGYDFIFDGQKLLVAA